MVDCLRSRTNKLECWSLESDPSRDHNFDCNDHPGNDNREQQNNNDLMIKKPRPKPPALCDAPPQPIYCMPKEPTAETPVPNL